MSRPNRRSGWFHLVVFGGALLLAGALGACGGGSSSGGTTGGGTGDGKAEVITGCCSSGRPAGYVKINDSWDPTTCGEPSSIIYNVCTWQRFDNKAVGAYMTVCAGEQPSGWIVTGTNWNPTCCGHPSSIIDNMWTIKRVS